MEMDDDTSMSMSMSMNMYFESTCDVGPLIFGWWEINSCLALWLSFLPVIALGIARHWTFSIVAGSKKVPKGSVSRSTALLDANGFESSPSGQTAPVSHWKRFVWTLVSTTGAALSLLSMLVVMTYNVGLFMAVLVGEFIGFWVWGNHDLPESMRACH